MADLLIACVSAHAVLFDKTHNNYKDNELKDNVWRSIADQLGYHDWPPAPSIHPSISTAYPGPGCGGRRPSKVSQRTSQVCFTMLDTVEIPRRKQWW